MSKSDQDIVITRTVKIEQIQEKKVQKIKYVRKKFCLKSLFLF
jgi:hypothetical protein